MLAISRDAYTVYSCARGLVNSWTAVAVLIERMSNVR